MRRALLIIALLSPLQASATSCITISWTARNFFTATTAAARTVALSPDSLQISSTLYGTTLHDGDVIRVEPGPCNEIVTGVEYYVATRCDVDSVCQSYWTEVARTKGFEQYAANRHIVTRVGVMERLRAWQKHKLSTQELQRWLSTGDAHDTRGNLDQSLTLAVVERVESLLEFTIQAEECNPSDAVWLREHGSEIFLERFATLPTQETLIAYDAWLDAHEDAQNEWDPKQLAADLELKLESAHSWDHTIHCFLRSRREVSR